MKLSVTDYRWILLNCNLIVGQYKGKQYVVIDPKYPKHKTKLNRILGNYQFPTLEEWNKISPILNTKRKNNDKLRYENAVRKLSGMSMKKLTNLNDKQKIEILDSLLVDVIGNDVRAFGQNKETVENYKEQIKCLLFGITLPKEFIEQEQARCNQFCNRLQSVPNLKEYLENWSKLEFKQRKELSQNILDVFNSTYHTNIELKFFTTEEWRQEQIAKGFEPDKRVMSTGFADGNSVNINKERMSICDNMAIPGLIYHEALHIVQDQEDWSRFPLIEKLFEDKFKYLAFDQEDLYVMNPIEVHAYGMDEYISEFLQEKMQIKFIDSSYSPELKKQVKETQEKARIMLKHSMYRNNNQGK